MIVLAIMAVIIAAFAINNPLAPKYKSLYYITFKNMQKFGGEVIGGDGSATLNPDNALFCKSLVKNLNTVGDATGCSKFYSGTFNLPYAGMVDADIDNPSFKVSNGQRFYVSERIPGPPAYRVISVDLNGESRPNKFDKDIIPFVMYDTGEVVPIGAPINDKDYLTTYVKPYNINTGNATNDFVKDGSGNSVMTFRDGFCRSGSGEANKSAANANQYCSSAPIIAVDPACVPGTTFCKMNLIKPMIYAKI